MEESEQNTLDNKNLTKDKDNIMKMTGSFTSEQIKATSLIDLPRNIQDTIRNDNRFNNVINTINNIEQWSLYLDEDIVYYKLVYRETHHDYITFMTKFKDVLDEATSKDDEYKACHNVLNKMEKSELK